LMIQGVGAHGLGWNPQVAILEKQFSCLTLDNRGIGASLPKAVHLSVDQMAIDALAIMDDAGWDSAHVLGHSMGGLVAMQMALMAKPRVRSLSLLCTFVRGADATRTTPALFWIGLRIRFAPRPWRRNAFLELVLPQGKTKGYPYDIAERLASVLGHDVADIPSIVNDQLAAMREYDATPRLKELSGIPTLVINGEEDLMARPSSGRAIAAGIPGSRFIGIPGASHAFPIVEPERCAALLLQHIAGAESAYSKYPV
ncbi:MAG: alpha/beta fold hydrolase, partial [Bryobacteraceae bacterium]